MLHVYLHPHLPHLIDETRHRIVRSRLIQIGGREGSKGALGQSVTQRVRKGRGVRKVRGCHDWSVTYEPNEGVNYKLN